MGQSSPSLYATSHAFSKMHEPHLKIPVVLRTSDLRVPSKAMIDSGATFNFLDSDFVRVNKLPTLALPVPIPCFTVDGKPLNSGPIAHYVLLESVHTNPYLPCPSPPAFYIVSCPRFPVILGLPWLKEVNPSIDWAKQSISARPQQETFLAFTDYVVNETLPPEYSEYASVFAGDGMQKLPENTDFDINIDLKPSAKLPAPGPLYKLGPQELEALRAYIDENLKRGFIRPSTSPIAAPVLYAPKPNGGLRLCVDYRRLNEITVRDYYPLPLADELLSILSAKKATIFTKIDLREAYYLLRIKPGDEWKTSFRCRYGQFEYCVMPFGLTNAPSYFQRYIQHVLRDYLDESVLAYFDDIIIFSQDLESHVKHVKAVLDRLREYNLFAKLEKCRFHQSSVDFVGYIISKDGVSVNPANNESVETWPTPKSVKEVQSFLGFLNFFRRFIPNFSSLALPLTSLTKKLVLLSIGPQPVKMPSVLSKHPFS